MCGFKKTGEDRFFMLLANERTGSTATMRLLSGHPEICGSNYDSRLFTNAFTWEGLFESAYINKLDFVIREVYRELDKAVLLAFLKFIAIKNQKKSTKNRKLYGLKCTFYNASLPMLKNMVRILKETKSLDHCPLIVHTCILITPPFTAMSNRVLSRFLDS